ncbi:protein distal antenna isoform X2 [Anastrepha ludens]|uniref:protein distal antenna isoform X2 n=1 Tax=Anastrepha ludens TaxID=28586 RepID=UPI0023AF1CEE|nr:protein distal antenna isoform X2 [Anastrepha ludens]
MNEILFGCTESVLNTVTNTQCISDGAGKDTDLLALQRVEEEANRRSIPIVIGDHSNTHHSLWGFSNTDTLEFKLFDNGLKLDISSYSHMNIRMSTKGKRPLRSLTPSDKIHAIQRIHDGESKASVARDIGVPESTLRGWCKNEDKLRFMSRQTDKITADSLAEKLGASAAMLPEKRQKLDGGSLPYNYSNKIKYDELVYKRSQLNGPDYSSNKSLSELGFNGLSADYIAFSNAAKTKVFAADISRQADPAIAAITPLNSLSHLSGLSGLAQSPLAISFNELTSNLNLLAHLNPGLAAMSGINGLAATASTLRNVKTKPQPQLQSPHSECGDRQQGLSVKNWAKQKSPTPTSAGDSNYGLNLCQNDDNNKNKIKCPSPSLAPSLGNCVPSLTTLSDDPLLYWLKSQQAMLGLSNIYPVSTAPPIGASSPPIRSPTPQQSARLHINTSLNASAPLTPSTTPSASLDDKNAAWFNWCKALGASLNSLAPAAAAVLHSAPMHQQQTSSNVSIPTNSETATSTTNLTSQKTHLENILFTQLTKNVESSPIEGSINNTHCSGIQSADSTNKPEDLSAKTITNMSAPSSPISTPPGGSSSPRPNTEESLVPTPVHSPNDLSMANVPNSPFYDEREEDGVTSIAECKDVLDNLLYKINNNPSVASLSKATTPTSESPEADGCTSESNASYTSDNNRINSDDNVNNNHSNKSDEEERLKVFEFNNKGGNSEAIEHGEKFLKWLENCSNPRITASHLMQLRFLISALKSNCEPKTENCIDDTKERRSESSNATGVTIVEDNNRMNKVRRRK